MELGRSLRRYEASMPEVHCRDLSNNAVAVTVAIFATGKPEKEHGAA